MLRAGVENSALRWERLVVKMNWKLKEKLREVGILHSRLKRGRMWDCLGNSIRLAKATVKWVDEIHIMSHQMEQQRSPRRRLFEATYAREVELDRVRHVSYVAA